MECHPQGIVLLVILIGTLLYLLFPRFFSGNQERYVSFTFFFLLYLLQAYENHLFQEYLLVNDGGIGFSLATIPLYGIVLCKKRKCWDMLSRSSRLFSTFRDITISILTFSIYLSR